MKSIIRGVGVEWRGTRVLLSAVEQVLLHHRPTSASAVTPRHPITIRVQPKVTLVIRLNAYASALNT